MFLRLEPSIVQRLLSSYMYFAPRASCRSASAVVMRRPTYSTMNAPFSMRAVANTPSPVVARPTRKGMRRDMRRHYMRIGGEANGLRGGDWPPFPDFAGAPSGLQRGGSGYLVHSG